MTALPQDERDALRQAIVRRFGSVHRFCKEQKARVNRATVYMVLAGTYSGTVERQVVRIQEALGTVQDAETVVMAAIKGEACARCAVSARPCGRCDRLFKAQAAAALRAMRQ